jgi:hypothetical protein
LMTDSRQSGWLVGYFCGWLAKLACLLVKE